MNVLQIANGYFDNKLYKHLFFELNELGIENYIYVPMNKSDTQAPTRKEIPDGVIVSKHFSDFDRFVFFHKQRCMFEHIEKSFDLKRINLIHAHTVFSNGYLAYKIWKKYHIPYVVAVRNTDINTFFHYMVHLRGTGVQVLREAKKIFLLSSSYRDILLGRYIPRKFRDEIAKKIVIIPNGVDSFWLENIYSEKDYKCVLNRFANKQLHIVYAGAINRNKNIEETCGAIDYLSNRGWTVKFSVAGRIVDQVIFSRIKGKVTYLGVLTKENLLPLYREADIFVMPSFTETFGIAYVEAMSQGLPVIYTKGQGFDNQFKEGQIGYHYANGNPEKLADLIVNITRDYEVLSKHSIEGAKHYNWKAISKQNCELYHECVKE